MNNNLSIEKVLLYYDGPELFVGRDAVDTRYLCMRVEYTPNTLEYISASISKNKLSNFLSGQLDLREFFLHPEKGGWFFLRYEGSEIVATKWEAPELPEDFLPETGFTYEPSTIDPGIAKEVIDSNKAIVHVSVADALNGVANSVELEGLGDVMKIYSKLLDRTYRKSIQLSSLEKYEKKLFLDPSNSKVRAFASSIGSFKIHLYSTASVDLFGKSPIEYGLKKLEEILGDYESESQYISVLRTVKGHTITSLKNLMRVLIDRQIIITHDWSTPNNISTKKISISKPKAERIYRIITMSEELTQEERIFRGIFSRVDDKSGSWRIINEEDGKEYSGNSDPLQLAGIIIRQQLYTLVCEEIIEENTIDEKETPKFELKTVMPV